MLDTQGEQDRFCRLAPSAGTLVGIFAGEWISRLPAPYQELSGGAADLFDDARIRWGVEQLGPVAGKRVLELGPLEGGHTYQLDRLGAREVTAVEGNTRAFLRCLVVKELLGMPSARFQHGDFVRYLEETAAAEERFDLGLLVGVLYHQQDPVRLLALAAASCDQLLVWTHYYDRDALAAVPGLWRNFPSSEASETAGYRHTLYRHEYNETLGSTHFCGGMANWANWMARDDIVGCLDHLGFEVRGIGFDTLTHKNGPSFCVAAERRLPR